MNHCACSNCHWGSHEKGDVYYCYADQEFHNEFDSCACYLEPCRIDAKTGMPVAKEGKGEK